jgi:AraC-like DNA-binding protein
MYIKVPLKNVFSVEKIVSIFELDLDKNFKFQGETHDFRELRYVIEGSVIHNYGGELRRMEMGDICFHEAGEFHDLYCDGVSPAKIAIISFECHSSPMNFFKNRIISVPENLRPQIAKMLTLSKDCFFRSPVFGDLEVNPNAPFGAEQLLRGELENFFIRLIQADDPISRKVFFSTRDELMDKLTEDIKKKLQENIYGKITLDDLCAELHFGKSHLCHVFKKQTGQGIVQYFIKLKTDEAKRLLTETERPINDISNALGFDCPRYFSRLFKQETGDTPTQFRKKARQFT